MALLKIHPTKTAGEKEKVKDAPVVPAVSKEKEQRSEFDVHFGSAFGMDAEKREAKIHRIELQASEDGQPAPTGFNPCRPRVMGDPKMPSDLEKKYGLKGDVWDDFRQQTLKRVNDWSYIMWGYLALCVVAHGALAGLVIGGDSVEGTMHIPLAIAACVLACFAYRVHVSRKKAAIKQISVDTIGKAGLQAEYIWVMRPKSRSVPMWLEIYPVGPAQKTAVEQALEKAKGMNPFAAAHKEPLHTDEEAKPLIGTPNNTIHAPDPPKRSFLFGCCRR